MCLWHLRWETVWSIQVHIVVEQFGWKRPPESNPSSLLVSCLRCQAASIFKDSSVPYAQHPWGKKKKKSSLCAVGMLHHAALSYWCCPCAPPRRAGFFMMESFLMHAEGSQKNSPLFSHLQEHQNDTSLTLIHLLCYSSLLSQWPPLTPRDQCCPMEASWHCVSYSGSHWMLAGCREWCCLMSSSCLSQCIWEKTKVGSHIMMHIILYIILSHLVGFFLRSCRRDRIVMAIDGVLSL